MKKIILSLFLFLTLTNISASIISAQSASQPCGMPGGTCNPGLECRFGYCVPAGASQTGAEFNPPAAQPAANSNVSDPMAGCPNPESINTAIGCIPVANTNQFMGWILGWAVGVGGGIAFLLIVYASFMIMTSQGVPDRLKAGQELLTSAISGLIMLIFSVFILKFIGIDILGLDKL